MARFKEFWSELFKQLEKIRYNVSTTGEFIVYACS